MEVKNKKIIAFDLDGTLTESKADLDSEMAGLIKKLLQKRFVAIMGGAAFPQFKNQFIDKLDVTSEELKNLLMFPTSSASYYRYDGSKWEMIYEEVLTAAEAENIKSAFNRTLQEINYIAPQKIYGEVIENRGTQVTFSALGQKAPLEDKQRWHDTADKRAEIKASLEKMLPEFEFRLGGLTSIDVTKKGIDKSYGIAQMERRLKIPKEDMIFIGDALYVGGNDYPVKRAGVDTIQVKGPEETKQIIQSILSQ